MNSPASDSEDPSPSATTQVADSLELSDRLARGSIFLIGARGSGKTTVARLLAERLGWRWLDADEEIERRSEKTISEIFAAAGEARFRQLEAELLAELCRSPLHVIATGGGAVVAEANRASCAARGESSGLRLTLVRFGVGCKPTLRPLLAGLLLPEGACRRWNKCCGRENPSTASVPIGLCPRSTGRRRRRRLKSLPTCRHPHAVHDLVGTGVCRWSDGRQLPECLHLPIAARKEYPLAGHVALRPMLPAHSVARQYSTSELLAPARTLPRMWAAFLGALFLHRAVHRPSLGRDFLPGSYRQCSSAGRRRPGSNANAVFAARFFRVSWRAGLFFDSGDVLRLRPPDHSPSVDAHGHGDRAGRRCNLGVAVAVHAGRD